MVICTVLRWVLFVCCSGDSPIVHCLPRSGCTTHTWVVPYWTWILTWVAHGFYAGFGFSCRVVRHAYLIGFCACSYVPLGSLDFMDGLLGYIQFIPDSSPFCHTDSMPPVYAAAVLRSPPFYTLPWVQLDCACCHTGCCSGSSPSFMPLLVTAFAVHVPGFLDCVTHVVTGRWRVDS